MRRGLRWIAALGSLGLAALPAAGLRAEPPALNAPAADPVAPADPKSPSTAKPAADARPGADAKPGDAKGREAAQRLGLNLSSSDAPLEINAAKQTLRERPDGGRISAWTGDVVLSQGNLKLTCQKLEISFASDQAGGAVEKIESDGNVLIVQGDIEMRCDRAVYEEKTCRAVCERNDACRKQGLIAEPALLRQGKDVVRGGRIELDVCSGDFQVSCGASGFFQPRKAEKKPEKKPEGKN